MKAVILLSFGLTVFFFILALYLGDKENSPNDRIMSEMLIIPALFTGVTFLAILGFAILRAVWRSL